MVIPSDALLTTKRGSLFSCSQPSGDISGRGAEGIFADDTRHLSRLVLTIDGAAPQLVSASDAAGDEATFRLACRDDLTMIRRRRIEGRLVESVTIENSGPRKAIILRCELASHMDDIFVVRGWAEGNDALTPEARDGALLYVLAGRDGVTRSTRVTFAPRPARTICTPERQHVEWDLDLRPGVDQSIELKIECAPIDERGLSPRVPAARTTGYDRLDRALTAARRDLAMLATPVEGRTIIAAGIPWFVALFGRDSLLTAFALLDDAPEIARDTLVALAERQATTDDAERDAEPGKILHELRRGEHADSSESLRFPYYGTVDATPLFVHLAADYTLRTGDDATFLAVEPHIWAALGWIDKATDADGLLRYERRSTHGLVNQGWKDSPDSIVHSDGRTASGPIALCEVQGYVYAAKMRLADVLDKMKRIDEAAALRHQAEVLRADFHELFWMDEHDCYALALDGRNERVASVTSNAGHCLWSGIAHEDVAARLAARLMAPDMFSGWGLRTLSTTNPAYDPTSYHRGSVWPHDGALVAAGLARYGLLDDALRIRGALLDVAEVDPARRLPELLCGWERVAGEPYVTYPTTCIPQAWSAASIFLLASLHN